MLARIVTFCDVLCGTVFAVWYLGWDLEFNSYMTNGFSHHYNFDESTFIFRGVGSDYYFHLIFSMEFLCYSVCLCPTKRTPDLYEIIVQCTVNRHNCSSLSNIP